MVNIGCKKEMVITNCAQEGKGHKEGMVGEVTQIFSAGIKEKSLGTQNGCG